MNQYKFTNLRDDNLSEFYTIFIEIDLFFVN